jgi:hypothetical protein
MQFNRPQKVLTIIYCVAIIVVCCWLTPLSAFGGFGSIFITSEDFISFKQFYIEIGMITFIYVLMLFIFKDGKL